MPRVRIPPGVRQGEAITLTRSEAHYVAHVLRMHPGERLEAFDGEGHMYQLQLTAVSPLGVQGQVVAVSARAEGGSPYLVLGQALPKGAKMDLIVEKGSELGLNRLVPLYTARTVRQQDPERFPGKLARWQRVAVAAARQCGRQSLLEVQPPMSLPDFCASYAAAPVKMVCWEEEQQQGLRQLLASGVGTGPVVMLVGPEGGWTPAEMACSRAHGFVAVNLGPHVLRTETAAMAVITIVRYSLGALEPQREGA